MFKMAGGKDKETALSRWQAIIPTVKSKSSIPRVSILTSGKQTGFAGNYLHIFRFSEQVNLQ
jgi:hypothetical protein